MPDHPFSVDVDRVFGRQATESATDVARPFEIDDTLRRIALPQLGLVAVRQALAAGVSPSAIRRRERAGLWTPVFRGVVRTTTVRPTPAQYVLAAALAVPGSVVVGPSAAFVDGMPIPAPDRPTVAVARGRSTRFPGVDVVHLGVPLPTRPWHTVRSSTYDSTLLMLPRFVDADIVERCLDHCLVRRLTSADRLSRLLDNLPSRAVPDRKVLLDLLAEREGGIGHRSGEERKVKRWLRSAGVDGFRFNVHIPVDGGRTIERDFVWWDHKAVLEVSPFITHGTEEQQARDIDDRRALVAAGWRVIEATDADLVDRRAFGRCLGALRQVLSTPPA